MTQKKIDELIQDRLCKMIKDEPAQMLQHMVIQAGRACVEANASTMDLKSESTLEGQRYEIKCKISIKKTKMQPNPNT